MTEKIKQDERFDFSIDQECIELYDRENLMCIVTAEQMMQLEQTIKESKFEWRKVNKKPFDYGKSPDRRKDEP